MKKIILFLLVLLSLTAAAEKIEVRVIEGGLLLDGFDFDNDYLECNTTCDIDLDIQDTYVWREVNYTRLQEILNSSFNATENLSCLGPELFLNVSEAEKNAYKSALVENNEELYSWMKERVVNELVNELAQADEIQTTLMNLSNEKLRLEDKAEYDNQEIERLNQEIKDIKSDKEDAELFSWVILIAIMLTSGVVIELLKGIGWKRVVNSVGKIRSGRNA